MLIAVAPLVLIVILALQLASTGFSVDAANIADTDTLMRLAYIREILAHGWQNGFFARDNAPYGAVLHWTKPFYYLIIAFYEGLRAVLPPGRALVYAGYFTGPLLAMVTSLAAYWTARPLMTPPLAMSASLAVVLSNSFLVYDKPGVANHHALLLLDFIVAAGFSIRLARRPNDLSVAVGGGLATAFAVWTSFEMLVLAGLVFAFVFYLWLLDGRSRQLQVLTVATSFSALTTVSVLIDPPYGGYRVLAFDHPSLPVLSLAAVPVVVALFLEVVSSAGWRGRLTGLIAACTMTLGIWLWLFAVLLAPVMQHMDPAVSGEMDPTIAEWVHIRRLWSSFAILGNGLIGLFAGLLLLPRGRYYLPIAGLLLALAIVSREHLRFAGYFWIAGTFVAAYSLQRILRRGPASASMPRTISVAIGAFLLVVFCQGFGSMIHTRAEAATKEPQKSCQISNVAAALNDPAWRGVPAGSAPIFANDFETTPGLLYWTDARTVAGYYHRDIPGVADLLSILRDNTPRDVMARGLVQDHGVQFVLVCPSHSAVNFSQASLALYYKAVRRDPDFTYAPPTLYDRLSAGHDPGWLTPRPWPAGTKTDLQLYQVNSAVTDAP